MERTIPSGTGGKFSFGARTPYKEMIISVQYGAATQQSILDTIMSQPMEPVSASALLEPPPCPSTSLDTLLGKNISAYGSQGHVIKGVLAEFDEYDIVLTSAAPVPEKCTWAYQEGAEVVVSRGQVLWREESVAKDI